MAEEVPRLFTNSQIDTLIARMLAVMDQKGVGTDQTELVEHIVRQILTAPNQKALAICVGVMAGSLGETCDLMGWSEQANLCYKAAISTLPLFDDGG